MVYDILNELYKLMFGDNIRRLRAAKELTQGKLAELASIHKRYYQDLEACNKIPSVTVASRIQKALRCDWTDLMRGGLSIGGNCPLSFLEKVLLLNG